MTTLAEKAKEVKIEGRRRVTANRRTKLPRSQYIEVAMEYLRGNISLSQILVAGDYKKNDVNSAYRIVAIGCRLAAADGLLEEVVEEEVEREPPDISLVADNVVDTELVIPELD
jgi:hypothetical protein